MGNESRDIELEKQIDAYVKGKLTEEQARQLWAKLLLRPDYIELLETELGVKTILDKQAAEKESENAGAAEPGGVVYKMRRSWKWMSAAAAAVILLVVSVTLFQSESEQTLKQLTLAEINIVENLSSAPVVRSDTQQQTAVDSMLNRGYQFAISGDLDGALKIYDRIIEQYGESTVVAEAYLNKGIIQFNRDDYAAAITAFRSVLQNVRENPVTEEKAYWYLGNAYVHTEDLELAREAINNAYTMDGIYRESASRLLHRLDQELGNLESQQFGQ